MKDQDFFSIKNKSRNNKDNPFNAYKANLNNKLSDIKINKKTLASSSTSYPYKNKSSTLSNIKPMNSYKETLNKVYSKLNSVLQSYNLSNNEINKRITNDIIFDERKRIVSVFKDYLLWYETSDFFKQYYKKNKSTQLMLRFIRYYETYTKFYPEYGPLEDVLIILKKNIKRKKKFFERIENEEEKKFKNEEKKDFERLIKDSEIKININNDSKISSLKNNSKSTLFLESIDKVDKNRCNHNDFYSILKTFIDYDDITFDKKELSISQYLKNNENYDSIFLLNSKLSKYVKKNLNEEKNKRDKKNRNIFIEKIKDKKYLSISPNLNILSNIINKNIRSKSKEEQIKQTTKKGDSNNCSLKNKLNNPIINSNNLTLKAYSHKYNENNSNSKNKKYNNTIRYNMTTHLIRTKPHNIKKLFNSCNKYEKNLWGNYYYKNNTENIRTLKSPKSKINNSPMSLRMRINKHIINSVKNTKRNNNHILNYNIIKQMNNINSLRLSNEMNKKDSSYYNINSHNVYIKLKNNKFTSNSRKNIKICKKNTIRKISPIKTNIINSSSIKNKKDFTILKNPFITENHSISISNNLLNSNVNNNKLYNNQKKSYLITDYNYNKNDIKIDLKKKEKLKKRKNNLILIKSNNFMEKNCLTNNSLINKTNKKLTSKKSFPIQNNKIYINNKNIFNNMHNNNNKQESNQTKNNNIIKKAFEKSLSKNELNSKLKIKNNSILKSCFSNINNNNNSRKKKLNDFNKIETNKKFSVINLDENSLFKNKIKQKNEDINKSSKKSRICLRFPITSNNIK